MLYFVMSSLFCETEFLAGTWVSLVWLNWLILESWGLLVSNSTVLDYARLSTWILGIELGFSGL